MIASLIWAVESSASRSTVASSTTGGRLRADGRGRTRAAPLDGVPRALGGAGRLARARDGRRARVDRPDRPAARPALARPRAAHGLLARALDLGAEGQARLGAHALRAAAPQPRRPGDRRVQAGRRASRRPGGVRDRPRERGRLLAADAAFARGRRRAARRRRQAARNARRAAVLPGALARQGRRTTTCARRSNRCSSCRCSVCSSRTENRCCAAARPRSRAFFA